MLGSLGLFVLLFLGAIPTVFVTKDNTLSEYDLPDYDLRFSVGSWNTSDYINFTGPLIDAGLGLIWFRIFIDDNDPSRNWSVYALNYSWVTGSGTFPDPYVIEDLYINGNGSGGMIFIKNSDKFFTIRNCWFNYSGPNEFDAGVLLQFTSNGMIVNNSFTYTSKGVSLVHLISNVIVDNNIFISDHITAGWGRAIQVSAQNEDIEITNNKIRDFFSGIWISQSINITLSDNYIESGVFENYDGNPVMFWRINDSEIIRNVLAGTFAFKSFLFYESGGSGNIIINNTVIGGEPLIFGPETAGVFLNTPKLSQDSSRQMHLEDSYNNLIAHNIMLGDSQGGTEEGQEIPGFDIFILLGMVGVISILLIIVKRKKQ